MAKNWQVYSKDLLNKMIFTIPAFFDSRYCWIIAISALIIRESINE